MGICSPGLFSQNAIFSIGYTLPYFVVYVIRSMCLNLKETLCQDINNKKWFG